MIGAGYIAVELAGVFQSLGTDTTLLVRRDRPLRSFDSLLVDTLVSEMDKSGLTLKPHSTTKVNADCRAVDSRYGFSVIAESCVACFVVFAERRARFTWWPSNEHTAQWEVVERGGGRRLLSRVEEALQFAVRCHGTSALDLFLLRA